jgi:hypothetical protein
VCFGKLANSFNHEEPRRNTNNIFNTHDEIAAASHGVNSFSLATENTETSERYFFMVTKALIFLTADYRDFSD